MLWQIGKHDVPVERQVPVPSWDTLWSVRCNALDFLLGCAYRQNMDCSRLVFTCSEKWRRGCVVRMGTKMSMR